MAEAWDFAAEAPPATLSPPLQALWWLQKGGLRVGPEWERAHAIAQDGEGAPDHDLVHALVHRIEGDDANAAYWYRRAGSVPAGGDVAEEWARLVDRLQGV
jgi:hypothetical protein